MPIIMPKLFKYLACLCTGLLLVNIQTLHAEGAPVPSTMDNPLVIAFVILMFILLLIIGILANVLLGVAQIKLQKEKKKEADAKHIIPIITLFILFVNPLLAQNNPAAVADAGAATKGIAGVSTVAFYMITSVIFLELLVIFLLLLSVKGLLRVEKESIEKVRPAFMWKNRLIKWWSHLNSFRPVEQEANLDLGHDYDGIRELDNRLPPWWLYGFYLTIIVACIYLWRFQVSHTGPSGVQEYETAVAKADLEVKEYLKKKGDQVDENTVTLLTAPEDIEAGKAIYVKSCVACHNEGGAGNVGPNLTDDYWLHGGDIKSIFKTIRYGINAMPQWQNSFSNKQIAELTSYVKSLKGTKPANPKPPQGVLYKEGDLPVKVTAEASVKETDAAKTH